MEESEVLNYIREQLKRINSCAESNNDGVTSEIVEETLENIKNINSIWKKDAMRYKYVANGVFMSDGRPFIIQTQYSYGKKIGQNFLTYAECNKIIDNEIDFDN